MGDSHAMREEVLKRSFKFHFHDLGEQNAGPENVYDVHVILSTWSARRKAE